MSCYKHEEYIDEEQVLCAQCGMVLSDGEPDETYDTLAEANE